MNTRDKILDVAAILFSDQGFKQSRMAAIAEAAEISRVSLYRYFEDKEAILIALNQRVIEDRRSVGLPLLAAPGSPLERLASWLRHNMVSHWVLHATRVVTMEDTQDILTRDAEQSVALIEEATSALINLIREGKKAGEIRPDVAPKQTALLIQSLILGLQRNNVSTRPLLQILDKKEIDSFVDLVINGIRS